MKTNVNDPRIKKLPRWVKDILTDQKSRIRQLELVCNDQEETRVGVYNFSSDGSEYRYLPETGSVHFGLLGPFDSEKNVRQYPNILEVRLEPEFNRLKIMGEGCLLIHPEASNVVTITQEKI